MGMSTGRKRNLWVAEVSPVTRVGRAYLPLRPGAEENAERAWLCLPEPVRARMELVGGFEAGPIEAEAWLLGVWLAEPMAPRVVHAGLRALAPFLLDARLLIGSDTWIEEVVISGAAEEVARTRVRRADQLTPRVADRGRPRRRGPAPHLRGESGLVSLRDDPRFIALMGG